MKVVALLLIGLSCVFVMVNYEHRIGFFKMPVLLTMVTSYLLAFKDLSDRFDAIRTPRARLLIGILIGVIICLTLIYFIVVVIK
jgi:hypothetical protein